MSAEMCNSLINIKWEVGPEVVSTGQTKTQTQTIDADWVYVLSNRMLWLQMVTGRAASLFA